MRQIALIRGHPDPAGDQLDHALANAYAGAYDFRSLIAAWVAA